MHTDYRVDIGLLGELYDVLFVYTLNFDFQKPVELTQVTDLNEFGDGNFECLYLISGYGCNHTIINMDQNNHQQSTTIVMMEEDCLINIA